MGVFDSDFSDTFRQKSSDDSAGTETNRYEFGGLQPQTPETQPVGLQPSFGGPRSEFGDSKTEVAIPKTEYGTHTQLGATENDFKSTDTLEFLNDGLGGSLIAKVEYFSHETEQPAAAKEEESFTDMASRLIISTAAGYVTGLGVGVAGLRNIPKIGVPLAIAAPFVVAGLTSSYQKTGTLSDMRSIAEGSLTYGGACGFKYLGRAIESSAHNVGVMPQQTMSLPLSSSTSNFVKTAVTKFFH